MTKRQPLPLSNDPVLPLNRSEWAYIAIDGPAGGLAQTYYFRFQGPLAEREVRQAVRQLLTAAPRLRAVLEPTRRRYQLRILPDNEQLDALLEQAFRTEVIELDDPATVRRWQELALNEPLPLMRGLGIRVQFAPHPTRAGLLLSVHHVLMDGRSLIHCIESLMKLLNGHAVDPLPIENSSMLPAILPEHWWQWPQKLWRSWVQEREQAREQARYEIIELPRQRSARHVSTGLHHHPTGLAAKDLSRVAKAMGGSANSLMNAALGTALLAQAGNRPGTAALIRMGVDLRRYFPAGQAPTMGNHVAVFNVLLPQEVPEADRVRWIDGRVRQALARFERREVLLPLLPYELLGLIRPHDYTRLYLRSKRLDRLNPPSGHTTNIGSADAFNAPDAQVRLDELQASVVSVAPLLVLAVANGQQMVVTCHPRDQYRDSDVLALMASMNQVMARWLNAGA